MNISLILVLVFGLIPLFLFLIFRNRRSSLLCISLKTLSSIFFIVIALLCVLFNKNLKINEYPNNVIILLTIIGLLFGLFGDFTLDFKIYFHAIRNEYKFGDRDSDFVTYVGIGAFFIGHIIYITSLILKYQIMWILYAFLIGCALSVLIVIFGGKLFNLEYGKWKIPCLSYCSVLCWFMISCIAICAKDFNTSNLLRLLGSIMFLISDLILSVTYFSKDESREKPGLLNPEGRFYIIANHSFYYVAQYLIAFSLLFLA